MDRVRKQARLTEEPECFRGRTLTEQQRLLDEMKSRGLRPNTECYNAALHALEQVCACDLRTLPSCSGPTLPMPHHGVHTVHGICLSRPRHRAVWRVARACARTCEPLVCPRRAALFGAAAFGDVTRNAIRDAAPRRATQRASGTRRDATQ